MKVHTVGDSHSSKLHGGWPGYVIDHHLGPKTCWSFSREHIFDTSTFCIQKDDAVIFALGEIDCRCHIHNIKI